VTDRLERGQFVRVRRDPGDEWVTAMVGIASKSDPQSAGLLFDGPIKAQDGYILGFLPLTIDYTAETVMSLYGEAYEIEVLTEDDRRAATEH
jgi:hypothetical protein